MMGWRDLIVTSEPRSHASIGSAEGGSVYFVDFVPRYENKSSLSIYGSGQNSRPTKPSTEHTKPIPPTGRRSQPNWLAEWRALAETVYGILPEDPRFHPVLAALDACDAAFGADDWDGFQQARTEVLRAVKGALYPGRR